MNLLLLGRGKTGSLIHEIAQGRGRKVTTLGSTENRAASGLTSEALATVDVVVDFTTPDAVLANIERCAELEKRANARQ